MNTNYCQITVCKAYDNYTNACNKQRSPKVVGEFTEFIIVL